MESPEKLVEDLLQKLELDKLEECREEEPEPGLYVLVQSDCIVELVPEIFIHLKPKIDLG
jgi:hypothetical protein